MIKNSFEFRVFLIPGKFIDFKEAKQSVCRTIFGHELKPVIPLLRVFFILNVFMKFQHFIFSKHHSFSIKVSRSL